MWPEDYPSYQWNLGDRKPGTKQMRIVLYLQVILPVQSGLSLIWRSPVPPDAVIESKVGISSLSISGKILTLPRTRTK